MMTFLLIAAAGFATFAYWSLASAAARRRGMAIGSLPIGVPLLAAAFAVVASIRGAHVAVFFAGAAVLVAGLVDLRTGFIFDPLCATLFWVSLTVRVLDGSWLDGTIGAIAIGISLFMIFAVTGGRGIGLGDVKLAAGVGAALGLVPGAAAMEAAFVAGAAYGLAMLAAGRAARSTAIRFGPFIATGCFVVILVQPVA
jgi:leader peptidase (prepilin peptidase)/N-methyltransferase